MAAPIPQEYYEDESKHGEYVYVTLEEMVRNFIANYTGDGKILRIPRRSQIIYQFKQGIKEFTINALKEVKAIELELGDTLDIILPNDYVNWVRISYVNPITGELMALSQNPKSVQATSYLQDNDAKILFDNDGYVLEGTSYFAELNDRIQQREFIPNWSPCSMGYMGYMGVNYQQTNFQLDTTKNINGSFTIDTRLGKIHFSSDNASRIIMLEYISDGLEYSDESDIKVSKLAEIALYNYVNYNLLFPISDIPMYEKKNAEKRWLAEFKNAKIRLMDIRIPDIMLCLNARRNYFRE